MYLHLDVRRNAHVLSGVFATFVSHKLNFKNAWNLTI